MNNTNDMPEDCPTCGGSGKSFDIYHPSPQVNAIMNVMHCFEHDAELFLNKLEDEGFRVVPFPATEEEHTGEPDELEELMAEAIGMHHDGANRYVAARLCAMVARGYYALKAEADEAETDDLGRYPGWTEDYARKARLAVSPPPATV